MTLPQRGRAIGWLGGILALGIFMPVMTLAGFVPDTARIRASTVAILALFLLAAFGIAISAWGRGDGQRLRVSQAPQVSPAPPVPSPSPHLSERERAAEVLGYAFLVVAEAGAVFTVLTRAEPVPDGEIARARDFLRCGSVRWAELGPLARRDCRRVPVAAGAGACSGIHRHGKPGAAAHGEARRNPAIRWMTRTARSSPTQRPPNSRRWTRRRKRSSPLFIRKTGMARIHRRGPACCVPSRTAGTPLGRRTDPGPPGGARPGGWGRQPPRYIRQARDGYGPGEVRCPAARAPAPRCPVPGRI